MDPDDHVCLCFQVSLRKLRHYLERERPAVPSQLADCLGAGTGCQWCVPFLKKLHGQFEQGLTPDLPVAPADYAARRAQYKAERKAAQGGDRPIAPAPPPESPLENS